jgi:hypothetical protein
MQLQPDLPQRLYRSISEPRKIAFNDGSWRNSTARRLRSADASDEAKSIGPVI